MRELRDGEPCDHKGCLHHISHPCEGCGRIAGKTIQKLTKEEIDRRLDFIFFRYKGNEYRLIGPISMKCPVTRKWIEAVRYEQYDNPRKSYVREINDFALKFEGFHP